MIQEPTSGQIPTEPFEFDSYDILSRDQQAAADAMLEAAYEKNHSDYVHLAGYVQRRFTGRTDSAAYLRKDGIYPVVDYVAERIAEDYLSGFRNGDVSGKNALHQIDVAFGRYKNLYGMSPGAECKARSFFQMRTFFREAVYVANQIGDTKTAEQWAERWAAFNHNNTLEQALEDYDHDAQAREEAYQQFQLEPDSNELWDEVIHQAEHEEARLETHPFLLREVTVKDLVELANDLRQAPSEQRFGLLARSAPSGKPWTSELPGNDSAMNFAMNVQRFQELLSNVELPDEAVVLGSWNATLNDRLTQTEDIKVKGGQISAKPIAKHTTFVDGDPKLLQAVVGQLGDRAVDQVSARFTDLPFESNSLSLVVGNRARQSMDASETTDFYIELSRILERGGSYIEQEGEAAPLPKSVYTRWKLLLAQMITDTATPKVEPDKQLTRQQEEAILDGLGFEEQHFRYSGEAIRVLTKKASIRSIGYHAVAGRGVEQLFAVELHPEK